MVDNLRFKLAPNLTGTTKGSSDDRFPFSALTIASAHTALARIAALILADAGFGLYVLVCIHPADALSPYFVL